MNDYRRSVSTANSHRDSLLRSGRDGRRPDSLSSGAVFELLSERRRRYALYHLFDADDPVDFDALVARVVDWETGDLRPSRGHESGVRGSLLICPGSRMQGSCRTTRSSAPSDTCDRRNSEARLSDSRDADRP